MRVGITSILVLLGAVLWFFDKPRPSEEPARPELRSAESDKARPSQAKGEDGAGLVCSGPEEPARSPRRLRRKTRRRVLRKGFDPSVATIGNPGDSAFNRGQVFPPEGLGVGMDGSHGIAGDLALLEAPGGADSGAPILKGAPRPAPIKSTRRPERKTGSKRKVRPFSFAVISDTHLEKTCSLGQGKWVELALAIINRRKPDFVVGLGDLVAGGGDCRQAMRRRGRADLAAQLGELKEKLLKKLKVPFVPVAGNHDLGRKNSRDPRAPRRMWIRFWKENKKFVLRRAARHAHRTSYRFMHKGVAFSVVGYYDTDGLARQEMRWVRREVRKGDLVFRHINPYSVSTSGGREDGGFAIRSDGVRRYEQLTDTLKKKKIRALFSGHTHAFYDGICDGLRFVNSGSLADRGMEYVKGWRRSPFKYTQAFVWVDVGTGAAVKTTFYFYEEKCGCFKVFNKRHFPAKVISERMHRRDFDEGVAATCITVGRGKQKR